MSLRERLGFDKEPLFLMDGTAFMFRFFFTGRNMQRSDGFPTNIIVGLARLLMRIRKEEQPKYFLFVRDGHGKNFRHALYEKYKANRDATPEDLVRQIEPVEKLVRGMGFRLEETHGFEADDCMASLAAQFSKERPVCIISGDKDLEQCLAPNVCIWNLAAKEEKILTLESFVAEKGIQPSQWPDVQALIGDTADNIPGVAGIGPKTALKIFTYCDSLEDIRDNLAKLPSKFAVKLKPHLESMFLWRKLTRLSLDYPLHDPIDAFAVSPMQEDVLALLAKDYELIALGREMTSLLAKEKEKAEEKEEIEHKETSSFAAVSDTIASLEILPDPSETTFVLLSLPNEPLRISFRLNERICEYFFGGEKEELFCYLARAKELVVVSLKAWLSDPLFVKVWGTDCSKIFDLSLACYLLRPEDSDYNWDHIESYWAQPLQDGSFGHAGLAYVLAQNLQQRLLANGLETLYRTLEMPLISVLKAMEHKGIAIDKDAFAAYLADVTAQLEQISAKIYEIAGTTFNIRSSQQLATVLTNTLHLTIAGKTKGGQLSTSQQNLEKLAGTHPIIEAILSYRKLEKLRSTYLEPLPRLVDKNGRLHTTFDQMGTATGRLSSKDPNLQNIPARGEFGLRMRSCFIAEEGNVLISSDYSQIELRMLAHMSQDAALLDAFHKGLDIHAHTAALMYSIPIESVSKEQRSNAKTINFGLIYGMGATKLAQELHVTTQEAKKFIDDYFARLQGLYAFYERIMQEAKQKGYVVTLGGRRRNLPDIVSKNSQLSSQAGRQAINTVIQGSAADVIKIAMLQVANDPLLHEMGCSLLLQVHDELIVEVSEKYCQQAGARVASLMESVTLNGSSLSVPLVVDWGFGHTWADAH